jgi:hypothetical protein
MQDPTQQSPRPTNPAGYTPLTPAYLAKGAGSPATAYVIAAAGFGLAVGLGIAVAAGSAHSKTAASASGTFSNHGSSLESLPAVYTGPAASLLATVETTKKASPGSPLLTPVSEASDTKASGAHKKHHLHKLWSWKKGSGKHDVAKRRPYVSPNPPVAPDEPTALERATAAAAEGPFFVGIEGDVTVASYDVASNRIQTYEGSNFALDSSNASAIHWQDYPFNVHYRCDGSGNCTLVHGSATANARMTR